MDRCQGIEGAQRQHMANPNEQGWVESSGASVLRWSGTGSGVSGCADSSEKPRRAADPPGLKRSLPAQSTETVPRRRACSLRAHWWASSAGMNRGFLTGRPRRP
jgi:hypothetical protein